MNFRFLLFTFIISLVIWDVGAQNQSPNCSNFSPAIDELGVAQVSVSDFLTNAGSTSFPVTVSVKNQWGGELKSFTFSGLSDVQDWNVCNYLGQTLEYTASNSVGNCRLGQVDLNGTPAVILTSAWSSSSSDPSVSDNKKVVYCGNIPSSSSHKPNAVAPCGGSFDGPHAMPDWVEVKSCGSNDTAEVILRHWEVVDRKGQRTVMTDTIIVMRLPKLGPGAFLGNAKEKLYCDLKPHPKKGNDVYEYASWKQPMGLADFEQPNSGLGAVVYNIPGYVIEAGLYNACQQGTAKYNSYLNTVIMKNPDNTVVTINDIISGNYISGILSSATSEQLGYGILNQIYEGYLDAVTFGGFSSCSSGSYTFYNYLFPVIGAEVLSEDGTFETVTEEWFYNGTGNAPYWFSGGWPSIYGSGDCVSYCDVHGSAGDPAGSVRVTVPRLIADGSSAYSSDESMTITLSEATKCGIKITRERSDWEAKMDCTKERGAITTITQSCWASIDNDFEDPDAPVGDTCLVVDYQDNEECCNRVIITLNTLQQRIDTLPPIFEFCYPNSGQWVMDGEEIDWDHDEIQWAIRNGKQYGGAEAWEMANPTIYSTGTHDCSSEVLVPDVVLTDNCSGINQVKGVVHYNDGTVKKVALEPTDTAYVNIGGGDVCTLYTYSHLEDPIRIDFNGCDADLIRITYTATDGCNTSTWNKYIQVVDDVAPTVVTNRNVNVNVGKKIELASAIESYDNGSWDNCAIDLMLARRSDWASDTACVILCWDETKSYDNWADILTDLGVDPTHANKALNGGKVGFSDFASKYNVDALSDLLNKGEVEQYYFEQIKSLWQRKNQCNDKVVHGWIFDLARHLSEYWDTGEDDSFDIGQLEMIFDNLFDSPGYGYEIAQLGGGWAEHVPFSCSDACKIVPTELLVVDYCCNWSIGVTETHLQEKSPAILVKELPDLSVTCEAYNVFYKDIVDQAAKYGDGGSASDTTGIYRQLDDAFGKYITTWVDNQGRPVDINGNLLPDDSLGFVYHDITCRDEMVSTEIVKKDRDGNEFLTTEQEKVTFQDTTDKIGLHGVVGINCYGTYHQDVIVDFDECGEGRIIRRFFIEGGCGDNEEVKREVRQVIHVKSSCSMQESMFDIPRNMGGKNNPICLPQDLTEDYMPDTIGKLKLKDHLFGKLCNSIATSFTVQPQKLVDYPDLVQFVITWKAIDWCCAEELPEREYEFVQKVIARIDPDCNVDTEGPGSAGLVYGKVETDYGKAVKDVEVKAVLGSGSPLTTVTQSDGKYQLAVRRGSSASLIPGKNTGFSEGVSTQDLIHIQRHLLGKEKLTNYYQKVAADVNANGEIDLFDLLELRQIVLRPDGAFANNTSWRFFEKDSRNEILEVAQVPEEKPVDWIGVKIGDVDQSGEIIRSNRHLKGELVLRMTSPESSALREGETYRVPVRSDNFKDVMGMQYTLKYLVDQVEIESIEPGALNVTENHYHRYAPGVITMSWSEAESQNLSSDEVLFTIVLKTKTRVQLQDVLSLNSRVTPVEAYSAEGLKDVSLRFDQSDEAFALYQNTPNPFAGQTTIGFHLPEAANATLSIYDVTGKMLKKIEGEYAKGYNEVKVTGSELNTTGVLYYQLDTKSFTTTRKMILIE